MISFKDKQVKDILTCLRYLQNIESSKVLGALIEEVSEIYNDQKMMTDKETDDMVKWALENVK